jgi:hypothetical protein
MSNIEQRAGGVNIRVGGVSSDWATLVPSGVMSDGQTEGVLSGTADTVSVIKHVVASS